MVQVNRNATNSNLKYYFFNTQLGKKLLSFLMVSGKKTKVQTLFFQTLNQLKILSNNSKNELFIFKKGLLNMLPFYEIHTRKHRGVSHTDTILVYKKKRRLFLLFKNLKKLIRTKQSKTSNVFAILLYSSFNKLGKYKEFQSERLHAIKQYPIIRYRW